MQPVEKEHKTKTDAQRVREAFHTNSKERMWYEESLEEILQASAKGDSSWYEYIYTDSSLNKEVLVKMFEEQGFSISISDGGVDDHYDKVDLFSVSW